MCICNCFWNRVREKDYIVFVDFLFFSITNRIRDDDKQRTTLGLRCCRDRSQKFMKISRRSIKNLISFFRLWMFCFKWRIRIRVLFNPSFHSTRTKIIMVDIQLTIYYSKGIAFCAGTRNSGWLSWGGRWTNFL